MAVTKEQKETKASFKVYELNEKVLCRHVDLLYYEAKITNIDHAEDGEPIYTVHYPGWNRRHDVKVLHSASGDRFLQYTSANVEKAKAEIKDAQARIAARKRSRKSALDSDKKSDSRGSAPCEKRKRASSRAESSASYKKKAHGFSRKKKASEAKSIPDFVRRKEVKVDYAEYINSSPAEVKDSRTKKVSGGQTESDLSASSLIENSLGLKRYFNSALGPHLLYKFERPQYLDFLGKHTKQAKEGKGNKQKGTAVMATSEAAAGSPSSTNGEKFMPSGVYGFVHLVRLFVKFGRLLALTEWNDRAIRVLVKSALSIMNFLALNVQRFLDLDADYEVATPDYQRLVWSS